eukprot:scaffold166440_cov26-Cyclotella_meneghiniana.AAC.1
MVEIGIHSLQWSPQADYRVKVGLNLSTVVPDSGTKIVTAGNNEWSDMVEIGIHSLQWSPQADYRDK